MSQTSCAKCKRPRAHPSSAYCIEHRREYNQKRRETKQPRQAVPLVEEESRDRLVQGLVKHLAKGGKCVDYQDYWSMTGREVATALEWYQSKGSQARE